MHIIEKVTIADVWEAEPEMIFYGACTPWWTHDESHLSSLPGSGADGRGLPCDPLGGVLYQTDEPARFLASAEANADHYGKHGLRAFIAAHHSNCVMGPDDPRPTCGRSWDDYNDAIDAADAAPDEAHTSNLKPQT